MGKRRIDSPGDIVLRNHAVADQVGKKHLRFIAVLNCPFGLIHSDLCIIQLSYYFIVVCSVSINQTLQSISVRVGTRRV